MQIYFFLSDESFADLLVNSRPPCTALHFRSGGLSAAPSELGEDQRHPGAQQSPDAGGADGIRGRGRHGPHGTTAPLAQPAGGQR